jgi:hypothetical protein
VGLQSAKNSAELLSNWFDIEFAYAKKWAYSLLPEKENIQVNQDVNAMQMLESLRNLAPEQSKKDIVKQFEGLPAVIQNEMHRLSKFVALVEQKKA